MRGVSGYGGRGLLGMAVPVPLAPSWVVARLPTTTIPLAPPCRRIVGSTIGVRVGRVGGPGTAWVGMCRGVGVGGRGGGGNLIPLIALVSHALTTTCTAIALTPGPFSAIHTACRNTHHMQKLYAHKQVVILLSYTSPSSPVSTETSTKLPND